MIFGRELFTDSYHSIDRAYYKVDSWLSVLFRRAKYLNHQDANTLKSITDEMLGNNNVD